MTSFEEWSTEEVTEWLKSIEVSTESQNILIEAEIEGRDLIDLTQASLRKNFGVNDAEDRKKILTALDNLKKQSNISKTFNTSPLENAFQHFKTKRQKLKDLFPSLLRLSESIKETEMKYFNELFTSKLRDTLKVDVASESFLVAHEESIASVKEQLDSNLSILVMVEHFFFPL